MKRALPIVAISCCVLGVLPSRAAPDEGSFSHSTSMYSIDLSWGARTDGVLLDGTIHTGARSATVRQTLRATEFLSLGGVGMPIVVTKATITDETAAKILRLDLWSPVGEFSGSVMLTFGETSILHRSEFHLPSSAVAPIVESKTRVAWAQSFALHGGTTSSGTITFDDGGSLDPYGAWEDAHRYGVFVSDPSGAFVGHGRIVQGAMANYIRDGRFRVGANFTEASTYFNGFLDAPSAGLAEGLWSLDALSFLPDGSTPGAYADQLANFPGFGTFTPPHPGDLQTSGQTVIAIADTGVNPYHEDFRNPAFTAHPSTYITGFPASAPALNLTLGSEYTASRNADDLSVWSKVQQEKLYWIPGTKIIGAYSVGSAPMSLVPEDPQFPERFVIDDQGHGTGTASVAAGYRHGTCSDCLLVIIEGTEAGVRWASMQPWIDMISNSYGPLASLPVGNSDDVSRAAYRAGKSVLYSAGNGFSSTGIAPDRNLSVTRPGSGPSWVITVGAASPKNDQDHSWHGVPSDVISYGSNYPAAASYSVTGEQTFSGTSCATPITAGVEGALISFARRALGDVTEGTNDGVLASAAVGVVPPVTGPLSDGVLSRDEAEMVLLKTAIPTPFDASTPLDVTTVPATPASFTAEGYGLVNTRSRAAGLQVLAGSAPMPQRPTEDAWIAATDRLRDLIWGPA